MDTTRTFVDTIRAYILRLESGDELTGGELATLVQELINREITEGGPYTTEPNNAPDIGFNLIINRLLHALDINLQNLSKYIEFELQTESIYSYILSTEELSNEIKWYRSRTAESNTTMSGVIYSLDERRIMDAVRTAMEKRLVNVPPLLQEGIRQVVERTIARNPDKQMSLMAWYACKALGITDTTSDELLGELGFANMCFWSSFIVYDDFWDEDEAADPSQLPVANFLARHYIHYFETLLIKNTEFSIFFHTMMDELDAANRWETIACRMSIINSVLTIPTVLPDYKDFGIKFYPAAGHIMGSVGLLLREGKNSTSDEVRNLIEYFRHYLIAMQLNDDAHDWQEDLSRGHISTAVFLLLKAWSIRHPGSRYIDLDVDADELQELFWTDVLVPLSMSVLEHTAKAQSALKKITSIQDPTSLAQFIDRNEVIAREALAVQRQSIEFANAYKPRSLDIS